MPPTVHLYRAGSRLLRRGYVLCGTTEPGHVTQFGPRVTCSACLAIMRGEEPEQ